MFDIETQEHCIYYVSRTNGGGQFTPSEFNVTRISESYVETMIRDLEFARELDGRDISSIEFWDFATDFASDEWEQIAGEEDPQCIIDKDVRLSDVISLDAEQAFIRMIPPSLELALLRSDIDGGIHIPMGTCNRRAYSSDGIYWRGIPKHADVPIETCGLYMRDLVQVKDWLATCRQIQEKT